MAVLEAVLAEVRGTLSTERLDHLECVLSHMALEYSKELQVVVASDDLPQVRAAALRGLINGDVLRALDSVLVGLADSEARVREVAVEGAGYFLDNSRAIAGLHWIAVHDPSQIIRGIAIDSLYPPQ